MLYSAIILGLVSSLHCIGMCGPIAMMLPVDRDNPAKRAIQILLYHTGRITAYGSLGLVFGILGKGFYLAGMQQHLSIIAGVVIITIALVPEKIFARYNFSKPVYKVISNIKTSLGSQFRKRGAKALFITGLLNGYLPCGLVYAALFGAIAMQSETLGTAYMMLYGVGTIPLMSAVVYVSGFLKNSARSTVAKIVPYAAIVIGILFIVRGLGLSISYVSPGTMNLYITEQPHCK
jgi:sulfite exporter TauE/SafE